MKTMIKHLKSIITEAAIGFEGKMREINAICDEVHPGVRLPELDLQAALTSDALASGRLPSAPECRVMLSGDDEEEDVKMSYLERTFPMTCDLLGSAWQLRAFR
jgi:hypothetical protein